MMMSCDVAGESAVDGADATCAASYMRRRLTAKLLGHYHTMMAWLCAIPKHLLLLLQQHAPSRSPGGNPGEEQAMQDDGKRR
jgi:hypothetical protein